MTGGNAILDGPQNQNARKHVHSPVNLENKINYRILNRIPRDSLDKKYYILKVLSYFKFLTNNNYYSVGNY